MGFNWDLNDFDDFEEGTNVLKKNLHLRFLGVTAQQWEDDVGCLDSPERTVSPQPPVWAPGGRFWTPPNPPAPGGWYAAAGPPRLSPSRKSWCTAGDSHPSLERPHTHRHTNTGTSIKLSVQLDKVNNFFEFIFLFIYFLAENFLLSCENRICIMCSDELSSPGYVLRKVWAQVVFRWLRGVKRPVSDRKSDRFALVNGPAVHFSAFKREQGFGSKEGLFVSARLVLHLSPLLQVWRLLMKRLMKCGKRKTPKTSTRLIQSASNDIWNRKVYCRLQGYN